MKNPKTFLLLSVIVGVLLLGVAYAAIQNIELTVSGTATATPDQGNFKVAFTDETTTSGKGTITAKKTGDLSATFTVTDLKKVGDSATVTFKILNDSNDLSADISYRLTHNNSEYFNVSADFIDYEYGASENVLTPYETGTLTVRVSLIKLPISGNVSDSITVTVTATPSYNS